MPGRAHIAPVIERRKTGRGRPESERRTARARTWPARMRRRGGSAVQRPATRLARRLREAAAEGAREVAGVGEAPGERDVGDGARRLRRVLQGVVTAQQALLENAVREALAFGGEEALQQAQRDALLRRDDRRRELRIAQRRGRSAPWPNAPASRPCAPVPPPIARPPRAPAPAGRRRCWRAAARRCRAFLGRVPRGRSAPAGRAGSGVRPGGWCRRSAIRDGAPARRGPTLTTVWRKAAGKRSEYGRRLSRNARVRAGRWISRPSCVAMQSPSCCSITIRLSAGSSLTWRGLRLTRWTLPATEIRSNFSVCRMPSSQWNGARGIALEVEAHEGRADRIAPAGDSVRRHDGVGAQARFHAGLGRGGDRVEKFRGERLPIRRGVAVRAGESARRRRRASGEWFARLADPAPSPRHAPRIARRPRPRRHPVPCRARGRPRHPEGGRPPPSLRDHRGLPRRRRPADGRALHAPPTGFQLDLLQIESVPQAFTWVKTFATSDQGEPHTQEHLLLLRGMRGRTLGDQGARCRW